LTIIGVIAALTVPNLLQIYKKHQVETSVKEAYSILSNAIKISESENGPATEWNFDYTSENNVNFAEKYLLPYLKVNRNCKFKQSNNECFGKIIDLDKQEHSITGYNIILANGMSLLSQVGGWGTCRMFVDIDGPKRGKGIIGHDVFVFSLLNKDAYANYKMTFSPGAATASWGTNYYATNSNVEDLLTTVLGACKEGARSGYSLYSGYQCSAAIAKNSWKIPDNYPIKNW